MGLPTSRIGDSNKETINYVMKFKMLQKKLLNWWCRSLDPTNLDTESC